MEERLSRHEFDLSLERRGFAVLNLGCLDSYYQFCAELGEIKHKLEVKLVPGSKIYANIEGRVPFHTDNPNIPIVAWHCLHPDSIDGSNKLIDSRAVIRKLSERDLVTLTGIMLPVPYSSKKHAILGVDPYHIYWLPRMIEEARSTLSENELAAVKAFRIALEEVHNSGQYEKLTLREGESLFVNNWVMLHGRNEISCDSKRHLVRVYIGGQVDFNAT